MCVLWMLYVCAMDAVCVLWMLYVCAMDAVCVCYGCCVCVCAMDAVCVCSVQNEERVAAALTAQLQHNLAMYNTTVQEDEAILAALQSDAQGVGSRYWRAGVLLL